MGMRAAVGSWVLLLVFGGLVTSTGLWGPGQGGTAVRAAPPTPPAVGTCLQQVDTPQAVPCTEPHRGEIVQAWPGTTTFTDADGVASLEVDQSICAAAAVAYLGNATPVLESPEVSWRRPGVFWNVEVLHGPAAVVPEWSWSACVVAVTDQAGKPVDVSISLRNLELAPAATLPDWARTCEETSGSPWPEMVACGVPHHSEVVGYGQVLLADPELQALKDSLANQNPGRSFGVIAPAGPVSWNIDHPAAEEQCGSMIESYLGAPLTVHEQSLRQVLTYTSLIYDLDGDDIPDDGMVVVDSATGLATDGPWFNGPDAMIGAFAECRIAVVGDAELTGSVAGIGNGPVPMR